MEWVKDIVEETKQYELFQTKKTYKLKGLIMYANKNNEIIHTKKQNYYLETDNVLSKEELIGIIVNNKQYDNTNYNSYKIMNFDIKLETSDLEVFLDDDGDEILDDCTDTFDYIEDIKFNNSMFNNLNTIVILFKHRQKSQHHTRNNKKPNNNKSNNKYTRNADNHCKTKRVNCIIKNKKTRKYLNIF